MKLKKYFQDNEGAGALATSSRSGRVDVAVYSTPHVEGRDRISPIMKDRLSHHNLKADPKAAYMFRVKGSKARGIRLYLKMIGEDTDQERALQMRKRTKPLNKGDKLYLVHFRVTRARALVGDREYVLS